MLCFILTWSCNPLLSLLLTMRRMRPFFSSVTRSVTIPRISMFCRPPSRPQVNEIFSSTRRCTLQTKRRLEITQPREDLSIHVNKLFRSCNIKKKVYLSTLTGGGRTLDTSEPLFPVVGMIVSPSDLSWSTKLSTSFPLAPSFRALLGPLDLNECKGWNHLILISITTTFGSQRSSEIEHNRSN